MIFTADNQVLTKNNLRKTFIIMGDSTALGRAEFLNTNQVNRRRYFKTYEWVTVWDYGALQLENLEYDVNNAFGSNPGQFGLELKFSDLLRTGYTYPNTFIKRAVGGSSLTPVAISTAPSSWDKATGTHYNNMITDITNACNSLYDDQYGHRIEIDAIICLLGLNDTLTNAASLAFESALDALVNNIYDDSPYLFRDRTKFLMGRPNGAANVDPTRLTTIRNAIATVAGNYSHVDMVDLDGLPLKPAPDLIHHNSEAELGDADSVALRFFNHL